MSNRKLIDRLTSLAQVATIDLSRSVENSGPYTAGNPQDIILDAIDALEAHEWQDIDENTPKDGSPIILEGLMREPNMGGERRITQEVHQGYWAAGMWQTGTFYQWVGVFRWMPMPQPGDKDE